MSSRKCIYTGKDAECTDKVVPKNGGDVDHNWANSAPCSKEYKNKKKLQDPSELELKANRYFYMLELAKQEVEFYTKKLKEIQLQLNPVKKKEPKKTKKKPRAEKIKDREIKIAQAERDIQELEFEEVLEKKKMEW